MLNTLGFHLTKLSASDNEILTGINAADCQITDPSDNLMTILGIGRRRDDDTILINLLLQEAVKLKIAWNDALTPELH